MNIIKLESFQISGDYNNEAVYDRFNELTGLNLEFEIGQFYGTDCYGIQNFDVNNYPTLEELERKIKNYEDDMDDHRYKITIRDVFNFLRRKGELPQADILFEISY